MEAMCDCAEEAAKLSKGSFRSPVMYYQRSMSEEAVNEQRIMSEAQAALDEYGGSDWTVGAAKLDTRRRER